MSEESNLSPLAQMLLARQPIWWDPPPFFLRLKFENDPELWRKYLEFDAEFVARDLEFQATKVREVAKMIAQYK